MTAQNEWDKARKRIQENAKKVDMFAEREAFETWREQCGAAPINPEYHDDQTGYTGYISDRIFDFWDAWLARAVMEQDDLDFELLPDIIKRMADAVKKP